MVQIRGHVILSTTMLEFWMSEIEIFSLLYPLHLQNPSNGRKITVTIELLFGPSLKIQSSKWVSHFCCLDFSLDHENSK